MYCYKHSDTETALSCGRCERPICTRCSRHTDVGVRCKDCAPAGMRGRPLSMRSGGTFLAGAIVLILVIVAATSVLDTGGADDYPYGDDYYDDYFPSYGDVAVNEVLDPWLPPDPDMAPEEGTRFIAVDVTIENDQTGPNDFVYIGSSSFRVTDEDSFVYQAGEVTKSPALPASLHLGSGEKARGWIVFQVAEDSIIETLDYYDEAVSLP